MKAIYDMITELTNDSNEVYVLETKRAYSGEWNVRIKA